MKRITTILFLCACFIVTQAQNHVFVLVDVSGSMSWIPELNLEARNQVYSLLTGHYIANDWITKDITDKQVNAIINLQQKPLIEQNSWLFLMPFGNKDTYKKYRATNIKNHPSDFENFFNSTYPTNFSDRLSFMKIAEAFTVSLAKSYGLRDYYIFKITDAREDNTGSTSPYDQFEDNLLMEYNNEYYSIVKNIGTLYKKGLYKKRNEIRTYQVQMYKVENVHASKIQPAPGITIIPEVVDTSAIIKISSPIGKKNKESELKSKNLTVSWTCANCPEGIRYSVSISGYDGNKFKDIRKDLTVNTTTFNNLSSGKYRITVSASNYAANSDTTYVSVSTSGSGWIIFLFILIAAGGAGYYFWNKNRQAKVNKKTNISSGSNPSNIFNQTGGTGTSTWGNK